MSGISEKDMNKDSIMEKARIYRQEIRCVNCINYTKCSQEMRNPELKHLYGQACLNDIYAAIKVGGENEQTI